MNIHIETVGRGEPLVLLHGWGLHGGLFMPLIPQLVDRFTVFNVDLPGHGYSDAVTPFDLPTLLRTLDAATASIEAPLNVLGWSFGGMLAQAWALSLQKSAPHRIKRLILSCTKPKFIKSDDWPHGTAPQVLQSFVDDFSAQPEATMTRFLTLNVIGTDDARERLAQLRRVANGRAPVQKIALTQGLEILRTFDVRDAVASIAQPTLVVTGGLDRLTHPSVGPWYTATLPAAQLLHIERAAHAPHLSHTTQYAQTVRDFADQHP
jgi:pimeloyl-[acyl-carrier protein] methyl ester esterase